MSPFIMNFFRRLVIIVFAGGVIVLLAVYYSVHGSFSSRVSTIESMVPRPVALVLGSSVKSRKPNSILEERLNAAFQLYDQHKVKKILLSGDNRTIDYNEPQVMKAYLIKKGIPKDDLILDNAGRRTYDSCYRARDIFGLTSVVIVTQAFHLPRALYLCNSLGVDAIGVAADEGHLEQWSTASLREIPATIQAWIDITFRKPMPLLGKPEKVF